MNRSRETIINSISASLNNLPQQNFKTYSGFSNNDYLTTYYNTDLVNEFADKLNGLSGNAKILNSKRGLNKIISDIFKKTDASRFIGWKSDELISIYKSLEKKGYKYIAGTNIKSQAKCDVGITLADYAISESGTVVIYNNKVHNRNSSLIVPIHIAILKKEQIVRSIFDLISRIYHDYSELEGISELSNCITFISGPSRTADIELNLTLGVHGPKELYVIII